MTFFYIFAKMSHVLFRNLIQTMFNFIKINYYER